MVRDGDGDVVKIACLDEVQKYLENLKKNRCFPSRNLDFCLMEVI